MKNKPLILGTLAVAVLMSAGCKKNDMSDGYPTNNDTNSASENAKEMATNAWQKTKEVTTNVVASVEEGTTNAWAYIKESLQPAADYTYDKKDAFVAGASADVDAVDQKIKELSDKAANAGDSVKTGAQAKLQDLNAKRAVLGQKLDDVKNSTEANWNDVKTGFKSSYDDVRDSLKQTWQSLTGN
jgi:vacuolar-type H+-ATPase subunit I/STV1